MVAIADVKKSFETELQAIFSLDQMLAAERSAIKRKAFSEGRVLTKEEINRRKEIAATRGELAEAMESLALDTVEALENASDVDKLLSSIGAVNQQLKDDLDRLQQIQESAAKVEAVAKGMTKVIANLVNFKKTLLSV